MRVIELVDSLSPFFTDNEFEVADILVDLKYLFLKYVPSCQLPFNWGTKRKRSAIDSPLSISHLLPPPPPPPPSSTTPNGDATSPSTPLSFSPSEPDCKSSPSEKKKVTRRTKTTSKPAGEWQKLVDELTQERETLKKEIEHAMLIYKELEAENSKLKALKHQLMRIEKEEEEGEKKARLGASESVNLATGLFTPVFRFTQTQPTVNLHKNPPLLPSHTHQVPYIAYQPAGFVINQTAVGEPGLQCRRWGPHVIPDLNVLAEESCSGMESAVEMVEQLRPLDVNTAASREEKAAMAKHNRHVRKDRNEKKRSGQDGYSQTQKTRWLRITKSVNHQLSHVY
ncbi:hypothetical protein Ancab_028658 [Ancistrocladus abbreviatus]